MPPDKKIEPKGFLQSFENPLTEQRVIELINNQLNDVSLKRIFSSALQSFIFNPGVSGWRLSPDGILTIGGLVFSRHVIMSWFESITGWTTAGAGTVTATIGGCLFSTGATLNNLIRLNMETLAAGVDFTKNPSLTFLLRLDQTTSQTIYLTLSEGGQNVDAVGFKIAGNTLSAYYQDAPAAELLTTISGITLTNYNVFRVTIVGSRRVEWYVNGILQATRNVDATVLGGSTIASQFSITTTAAADKKMRIRYVFFEQDL